MVRNRRSHLPTLMPKKITVLGSGSWGATLGVHLSKLGHSVKLWEFFPELARKIDVERKLSTLPQLTIPAEIYITHKLAEAFDGCQIVISAVPSQFVRDTYKAIAKEQVWPDGAVIVSVTKGLDNNTLERMSEVITQELQPARDKVVVLSGPSHAEEVAVEMHTAVAVAHKNNGLASEIQNLFRSKFFHVYTNPDPVGTEVAGALKNIYAIACGLGDGLGFGDNTKAALVSRSVLELARLGVKMGGKPSTFFGLAGLGDLMVTCFSKHSRNRLFGEKLGQGGAVKDARAQMTMVVEGIPTSLSAYKFALKNGVNVPILNEVYHMIYEGKSPREAFESLLEHDSVGYEMAGLGFQIA